MYDCQMAALVTYHWQGALGFVYIYCVDEKLLRNIYIYNNAGGTTGASFGVNHIK